eukprot:SAG22_NODE_20224_length_267_cov_0.916667_1_plen_45_part_10
MRAAVHWCAYGCNSEIPVYVFGSMHLEGATDRLIRATVAAQLLYY